MERKPWSPYLAGGVTGLLNVLVFLFSDNSIGTSATFSRAAGYIERHLAPGYFKTLDYFTEMTSLRPEWQMFFVGGIFIGSVSAALLFRDFSWQFLPGAWEKRFGETCFKRWYFAFLGGVVAMFGARMAGGCPSGHGLSGTLQLALSSLVTVSMMFAGGIVTARVIFGRK